MEEEEEGGGGDVGGSAVGAAGGALPSPAGVTVEGGGIEGDRKGSRRKQSNAKGGRKEKVPRPAWKRSPHFASAPVPLIVRQVTGKGTALTRAVLG